MFKKDRRNVNQEPPVKEGDEFDVRIDTVGEKGDGVARKKGFVLFVANTKAGDEVRVRVTKVLRNVGFAEVIGKAQAPVVSERRELSEAEKKALEIKKIVENAKRMEDSEDFGEE